MRACVRVGLLRVCPSFRAPNTQGVNIALLFWALIYEFFGQNNTDFLVCVKESNATDFRGWYNEYISTMGSANLSFPGYGDFTCVPQVCTLLCALCALCVCVCVVGWLAANFRSWST